MIIEYFLHSQTSLIVISYTLAGITYLQWGQWTLID